MNSDNPLSPREELEARLTAMLLGELTGEEADALRRTIETDAEMARLYERLKQTMELVRETALSPSEQPTTQPVPLRLSSERRQQLLQQFKVVALKEKPASASRGIDRWLVPLGAAAALVLLVGIMVPNFTRARETAAVNSVLNNLRILEGAKQQWALENNKAVTDPVTLADLKPYLKGNQLPQPVLNEAYVVGTVSEPVTADIDAVRGGWAQKQPPHSTPGERFRFYADGGTALVEKNANPSGHTDSAVVENLFTTSGQRLPARPAGSPSSEHSRLAREPLGLVGRSKDAAQELERKSNGPAVAALAPPPVKGGQAIYLPAGSEPAVEANVQLEARTLERDPSGLRQNLEHITETRSGIAGGGIGGGGGFGGGAGGGADTVSAPTDGTRAIPSQRADNLEWLGVLENPATSAVVSTNRFLGRYAYTPPTQTTEVVVTNPSTGLPATIEVKQVEASQNKPPGFDSDRNNVILNNGRLLWDQASTFAGKSVEGNQQHSEGRDNVPILGDTPALGFLWSEAGEKNFLKQALPMTVHAPTLTNQAGALKQTEETLSRLRTTLGERVEGPADDLKKKAEERIDGFMAGLEVQKEAVKSDISPAQRQAGRKVLNEKLVEQDKQIARASEQLERLQLERNSERADLSAAKPAAPAPVPQPETQTRDQAYSTFSLNVSDVSFKLAAASLEKGQMPDPPTVRSEEFINAFDYRDPEPSAGLPIGFSWERSRYPFAHNRDLLRLSVKTAAQGRQPGRPLNLVLLLDNSGSMERADRVGIIHEALRVLATQLQPQDKLSVIAFARTARLWVDGVPGDQAAQVAEQVSSLAPQGGTNLEEAMNLAYQTALRHYLAQGVNRVVLLTDGAANLGNVDPEALKQKVEAHRKQGVALDCFGIGWEGFNDDLLEILSRHGDGRYGFINAPEEAASEFAGQLAGALRVAASDVKVQIEFNPKRVSAYRQIGYAKHQLTKEQFRDNTVDAAEIGAAESGNALYVVEVNSRGEGPLAIVRVRYREPGTGDYREHVWAVPFTGQAVALEQASPAMRLAATASAFSEWLVSSPHAAEVTPDRLLGYLSGVPEIYGADPRPKKLEWMIRQAKAISGK